MLSTPGPGTASTSPAQWLLCAGCWRQPAPALPRTSLCRPLDRQRHPVHGTASPSTGSGTRCAAPPAHGRALQHRESPEPGWHRGASPRQPRCYGCLPPSLAQACRALVWSWTSVPLGRVCGAPRGPHAGQHLCCGQVGCTPQGPSLLGRPPLCSPSRGWQRTWPGRGSQAPAAWAEGSSAGKWHLSPAALCQQHRLAGGTASGTRGAMGAEGLHDGTGRCGPGEGRGCSQQADLMDGGMGTACARCQAAGELMQPAAHSAGAESLPTPRSSHQRGPATECSHLPGIPLGCGCSTPTPCSTRRHPRGPGSPPRANPPTGGSGRGQSVQAAHPGGAGGGRSRVVPWCRGRSHPRRWRS